MDFSYLLNKDTKEEYKTINNIEIGVIDMEHKDEFNIFNIDFINKKIKRNNQLLNSTFNYDKFLNHLSNIDILKFKDSDILDLNNKFAIKAYFIINMNDKLIERTYYTSNIEIHKILNILSSYLFKL